jgi:uncharacterized protein YggU (UPF0235/DUF167 family)
MRLQKHHISVKVIPNSQRNQLLGWSAGCLKVRIQAPAGDQPLASRLERFLAAYLEIPLGAVTVVSGFGKLTKTVEITGLTAEKIATKLGIPHGPRATGRELSLPAVAPSA